MLLSGLSELFPKETQEKISRVLHNEAIHRAISLEKSDKNSTKKSVFPVGAAVPSFETPGPQSFRPASGKGTLRSSTLGAKTPSSSGRCGRGKKFGRFFASLSAAGERYSRATLESTYFLRSWGLDSGNSPLQISCSIPPPPTCVEGTSQVPFLQVLWGEVDKMLEKGTLELVDHLDLELLQQVVLGAKVNLGWHPVIDLLSLKGPIIVTKFTMDMVSSVFGAIRKGAFMFLIDLKGTYFQIPIHPGSQLYLWIMLEGKVYQFKALLQPFDSSRAFTRVFDFDPRVGSSERNPSPLLFGWLAGECGVGSFPSTASRARLPVLLGLGDCHQSGVVRLRAIRQGSVSWDGDRQHLREGLPDGLSYCQAPGSHRHVASPPVSSCQDMAAASRPHGVPEIVCTLGSLLNVPSWVAAEGPLVSNIRQSSGAGSSISEMQGVHLLVASGEELVIRSPTLGSPSFSLSVHWCVVDQLGHPPSWSDSGRHVVLRGEGTSHQCFGKEGSSSGLGCLCRQAHWRANCCHEQERLCCDVCEEARGHCRRCRRS